MLAEFNAEKARKEKEEKERKEEEEKAKAKSDQVGGTDVGSAEAGADAELEETRGGSTKRGLQGKESSAKRAPAEVSSAKDPQHTDAVKSALAEDASAARGGAAQTEAPVGEVKLTDNAGDDEVRAGERPADDKGSARSRGGSEVSSAGLSELLGEGDKDKASDSEAPASILGSDDEAKDDGINLPSPKITASVAIGAQQQQSQGVVERDVDSDEPPSLPTSLQSTPKSGSARAIKVDDILHPSQALAIGGQTTKDLQGLDKLLAKGAPPQGKGDDDESDWDLDMSSQVRVPKP